MTRMAPVYFALDQHNYARWLTVHISANESHEFNKGHFVLKKTVRPFSKIALDHAHEQNNAIVKGEGALSDSQTIRLHSDGGWSVALKSHV